MQRQHAGVLELGLTRQRSAHSADGAGAKQRREATGQSAARACNAGLPAAASGGQLQCYVQDCSMLESSSVLQMYAQPVSCERPLKGGRRGQNAAGNGSRPRTS